MTPLDVGTAPVTDVGPRLLRLDAPRSLAAFFGVGAMLCWAAALLPHDPGVGTHLVAWVGLLAGVVAVGLLLAPRPPRGLLVALVAAGSVLIAVLVGAGRGTGEAIGFAGFIVWVAVYSVCFFTQRVAILQTVFGVGAIGVAWGASAHHWAPLLLAAASAVTTALVVGNLVDRVRAGAELDPATGLASLAGFHSRGEPMLAEARRSGKPVAVLLLHIRGLAQVVESLGHGAGEELVARVGAVLAPAGVDHGVLGARIGQDRLACLLPATALAAYRDRATTGNGVDGPSATASAVWAAEETLGRIRGPHRVGGIDLQVEGCVGVVIAEKTDDDLTMLLRAGEAALTEAVRRESAIQVYDPSMAAPGAHALRLLAELRDAIPADQLRVYYQVQVDARTGRPRSVEALVRWQHPQRGLLLPGAFLPIAEPTDVIVDLTRWVLEESLRQCAAWLASGRRVPVSVNLSARLLTHAPLPAEISALLGVHGVPAELLTIEVTETALVTHPDRAAALLTSLQALGIRTSLDDFGTGQTSLALLAGLPFDELKIDRCFITTGHLDIRAQAVIESIVHLGHGLSQHVVAEGIEDEATADWLIGLGCDVLQGFYFGRPQPAAALVGLPWDDGAAPPVTTGRPAGPAQRGRPRALPAADGVAGRTTAVVSTAPPPARAPARAPASDEDRPVGRRSVLGDRRMWVVAVGLLAWVVAYGVSLGATEHRPIGRLAVQSGLGLIPAAAAVVVTGLAAARSRGPGRTFWAALAAFTGLSLAGQLVRSAGALTGHVPGWAAPAEMVLHGAAYLAAPLVALFIGGRPRMANRLLGVFDLTAVATAIAYQGYQFALGPALARHAGAGVLIVAAYPELDALTLIVAFSVGVAARHRVPLSRLLVTASFACLAGADIGAADTVHVHGVRGLLVIRAAQSCLVVLAGVVAVRHREADGPVRKLPGRLSMAAVFAITLNVLHTVALTGLTRRLTRGDVVVGGLAVLVLILRGLMANAEVRATASHLERARAEQERLAVTDGLTGLHNRRFFEEFLRLEGDRSRRRAAPLSLIVADLDHFKRVNDRDGHPVGDRVLADAARRLRTAIRSSDVIARYGGEEFVIVLPDTDSAGALEVAERCRQALVAPAVTPTGGPPGEGDRMPAVTGSFGVATLWAFGNNATVEDLVRAADRALYRAKATGRNRVAPAGEWDFLAAADLAVDTAGPEPDPVTESLLRAAELLDADQTTDQHGVAMARWATVIATDLGLDEAAVQRCALAARLHDIGKLAIPRSVLARPGPLSDDEWTLVRTHPEHSEALVALSAGLADLGPIVRAHHERFDGTGYPDGLAGSSVPVEARIISVCDAWAAMRATRCYSSARSVRDSRAEIAGGAGSQFDPDLAAAFLRLQDAGRVGNLTDAADPSVTRLRAAIAG